MIIVYPRYFMVPVIIDRNIRFASILGFRNNEEGSNRQIANDEFFECDNEFINSEI